MSQPLEPGVKLSGHLLSEEIGQGGYSRVFRAVPEAGGEAVAIKVAVRPELVQALSAEGAVLRRLQGPRFVKILAEHLDADPPYFVLELCSQGDLRARLDREPKKRLPVEDARRIARGILEGMAFAHDEGVVHGDLKPENVLLDAQGEPKIADLGLSRAARRDLLERLVEGSLETERSKVRGTFDYLAPEVRAGGAITPSSDVYALGVLVYELLTGERPLGLFKLPGEALSKEGIAVPAVLDAVVARALAHDPEDRFPDASGMLTYLDHGDAAAEIAVARRRVHAPKVNPLLTGALDEWSYDQMLAPLYVVLLWSILPVSTMLALGFTLGAEVLGGIGGTLVLVVLVASAVHRVLARRLLLRRLSRALEEPEL